MEAQVFIKSDPAWLSQTDELPNESSEPLPTDNQLDDAGDKSEDERMAVKKEHQIMDDTDHARDINFEVCPTPEFVPCLKRETTSPHLEMDMKEETHDEENVTSGNHLNDLIYPYALGPAVKEICTLSNIGLQYPNTTFGRNYLQKQLYFQRADDIVTNEESAGSSIQRGKLRRDPVKHDLIHSSKKPLLCKTCNATFSRKDSLRTHMLIHSGLKPYSCSACEAKFGDKRNLRTHMLIHSIEKPYSCSICVFRCTQKHVLRRHMLIHSGDKPYPCDICEAKFGEPRNLERHMLMHSGEKPYSCSTCEAKFATKSTLRTHTLIHSSEKRFSCSEWMAKFKRNGDLERHLLIHSGKKPYSCNVCEAKFVTSGHLKRHFLIHTGMKSYACSICDAKFAQKGSLKAHILNHSRQIMHAVA